MHLRALAVLAMVLTVGCGPAGEEHDDASLKPPERAREGGSVTPSKPKPAELSLSGRLTQRTGAAVTPVADRTLTVELTTFYIFVGMGMTAPYARLSVATNKDGEFRIRVPLPGHGSLSTARIAIPRPRAGRTDPADPTPPPPPPPPTVSARDGPQTVVPVMPVMPTALWPRGIDPTSPSFELRLSSSAPKSGTTTWRRTRRSRSGERSQRQYVCAWALTKPAR